jgi:hypothetical protein
MISGFSYSKNWLRLGVIQENPPIISLEYEQVYLDRNFNNGVHNWINNNGMLVGMIQHIGNPPMTDDKFVDSNLTANEIDQMLTNCFNHGAMQPADCILSIYETLNYT